MTLGLFGNLSFLYPIQYSIDNKKEVIRCSDSRNVNVDELPDKMPEAVPRFNLYRYSHVKDGKFTEFVPGKLNPQ